MKNIITTDKISDFAKYLKQEEKSPLTVEKYIRDVRVFSEWVQERENTETVNESTKELSVEYKQHLIENGYAKSSINSVIASLNSFFEFSGLHSCKLKSIKIQKQMFSSEKKELTKAEYMRLISAAETNGNKRLSMLIETIGATGIRISELEFITVEAVKNGEAVVSLKGKTRRIFIVNELKKKLLRYITEQNIKTGCIFVTRNGRPMSRCNIWREMKNICKRAGVNPIKVFPHNLRHLFARVFYKIEKDIAKLADILGHSSINTTRIYITTTIKEHRKQLEKMKLTI